ncbi:hypothetical protein [Aureimonas phyllosphaerae]|uniref:Phage-related tail fiber protein n=1 Tax=Aureimonas phyllosphaerae TaxID=1166078 RepID=A0A7W6FVV8_9HYPH|nr:hypothetical protein [Aureimonas phyllosphaerae]MBB3937679.1 phage-related tail fiber protein [Aureimonas phyllosphaerae]MBB3961786.1 phage-related tail fiber protein [Aureimonas phyllosphaerae]SFF45007.1 hypothetical protein SAMN05216566_11418 [Aureimonas phyllosphaerae]
MTDKVTVKALRPFDNGDALKDELSEPFEVTRQRYADLKANGLVEAVGGFSRDEHSDVEAAISAANQRVSAANEAADRAVAEHEARAFAAGEAADRAISEHGTRVTSAGAAADDAILEHEARVTSAKAAADEAIAAHERRVSEAAEKASQIPDHKNGSEPPNKAAPKPSDKAK